MIERMTVAEWIAFEAAHPAPTFFASPGWALALAQANDSMQVAPLRIRTSGGWIVLPLVKRRGGTLRWRDYCGFPMGGYTCFLHEDGSLAAPPICDEALRELRAAADTVTIVPWPLAPGPSAEGNRAHETAVIDLSNGAQAALAGVEGIFRRMAGQAQRRGVCCAPCRDADAADRYYALLEASAKRWGLTQAPISKGLIDALLAQGAQKVEIWFARAEDCDLGGGIVFIGSQELFFWSAAMLAEHGRLRPSNALNVALIKSAAQRGLHWYNLGASEGLPGVARFKKEMGARSILYRSHEFSGQRYTAYARLRRSLAPLVRA